MFHEREDHPDVRFPNYWEYYNPVPSLNPYRGGRICRNAPIGDQAALLAKYSDICMDSIGAGQFGDVFAVRKRRTNTTFACKVSEETRESTSIREINALHQLGSHPSVVPLVDAFSMPSASGGIKYYMMTPLYNGGNLHEFQDKFWSRRPEVKIPEAFIWKVLMQVSEGLHWIHTNSTLRLIHRDIKPGNIMLDVTDPDVEMFDNLKIIDFGLCTTSQSFTTACGTFQYQGREIPCMGPYTDIYGLGAIIYELATLRFAREQTEPSWFITTDDIVRWYRQNPVNLVPITIYPNPSLTLRSAASFTYGHRSTFPHIKYSPLLQFWLNRLVFEDYQQRADSLELVTFMIPDARKLLRLQQHWWIRCKNKGLRFSKYEIPNLPDNFGAEVKFRTGADW